MPNRIKVGLAVLGVLIARDLAVRPYRSKYKEIIEQFNQLVDDHNALSADVAYLVRVLNDNEIELSSFDLLVLTNVVPKES